MEQFLSPENFWAAWEKVAKNRGCAGVDDETIPMFGVHAAERLAGLRKAIRGGYYVPLPVKQFWIPKKQGGWREL
ncbi:MAG: CRISPR-associated endonuclease Cas1, partial [Synechococcales cyanobacterium RM1_1_8]|nr:CRISPR-associated endonuclease Cas1 [Synechococcales cyanobacterium RM1_1_8]